MKKLGKKLVGVLVVGIMLMQSSAVLAVSQNQLQNQQSSTDEKINQTKEELQNIQATKSDVAKQVEDLTSKISQYETQIDDLDSQISDLNTKIEEAQGKLNEAEEDFKKQEELLQARLVATYEAGDTSYLDVLLSSSSITQLISNYFLVTEVATNDTELLDTIEKQKQEIEQAKQSLENSKTELDKSKESKKSVSAQLQTSKKEKDTQVAKLSEDEKVTQKQLEEFQADKRAIANQIAAIAAEEARKQREKDQQKPSTGGSTGGSTGSGTGGTGGSTGGGTSTPGNPSASGYIRPVSGYSITTGWYGYAGHTGADFSGANILGKPVYAVKSGTVVISTALTGSILGYRSYGEYILINHHDGTMTLYAHGKPGSRLVGAGQSVSQGQQIMSVGNTGNVQPRPTSHNSQTGAHLHFEVWLNGKAVNPAPYLP